MQLHELAHERQADTEPAFGAIARIVCLDEQIEDMRQEIRR